jgi:hypothetical protein
LCFVVSWLQLEVLIHGKEAVEVDLLVVIHAQMPVALAALQDRYAHEHAPDIAGEAGVVRVLLPYLLQPPGDEVAGAALLLIEEIRRQHLAHHRIPWLVGLKCIPPATPSTPHCRHGAP